MEANLTWHKRLSMEFQRKLNRACAFSQTILAGYHTWKTITSNMIEIKVSHHFLNPKLGQKFNVNTISAVSDNKIVFWTKKKTKYIKLTCFDRKSYRRLRRNSVPRCRSTPTAYYTILFNTKMEYLQTAHTHHKYDLQNGNKIKATLQFTVLTYSPLPVFTLFKQSQSIYVSSEEADLSIFHYFFSSVHRGNIAPMHTGTCVHRHKTNNLIFTRSQKCIINNVFKRGLYMK